jgi:hypothetical protein
MGVVGGWEKFQKRKKNRKNRWGAGENKVVKKNWDHQGKPKKWTWDGIGIEKRILSVHRPSTLVHSWVLVHSGRAEGGLISFLFKQLPYFQSQTLPQNHKVLRRAARWTELNAGGGRGVLSVLRRWGPRLVAWESITRIWHWRSWMRFRASPTVLRMGLQTVKFNGRKSKCAGLA